MSERVFSYRLKRPVRRTPAVDEFGDPRGEIEVVTFDRDYLSAGDIRALVTEFGALSDIVSDEATRTLAMAAVAERLSGLPRVDFDNIEASDLAELLKKVACFFPSRASIRPQSSNGGTSSPLPSE